MTTADDEAEKLWIARAIGSPDAWRSRATNAAGLLSAAAAATLAGLVLHGEALPGHARFFVGLAGAGYTIAVICYLVGAVWPSPKEDKKTLQFADAIWEYCGRESKPIKRAVFWGTFVGGAAVIATGIAVEITASAQKPIEAASVTFFSQAPVEVTRLCPDLAHTFHAKVEDISDTRVRLRLARGVCNGITMLEFNRSALLIASAG